MPRGKPVVLSNGREWATRQSAEDHFRSIRDRQPLEMPIEDQQDHSDLCALLDRYDTVIVGGPSKIGCGIKHFITRTNEVNGGKSVGFWVVRTDGTDTDFSFISAVSGRAKDVDAEFLDACRETVYDAVAAAKAAHFAAFANPSGQIRCEVTDELVTSFAARLDYAPTDFRDIVWGFRKAAGWDLKIPPGTISKPQDGQLSSNFVDIDAMARFRAYHAENAQMRVISKAAERSAVLATRSAPVRNPIRF